jgi:predicted nucleic-acid-binding protein
MLGIDTNVLVRYLVKDDARQTKAAKLAVEQAAANGQPLALSLLALMETEWVLRSRYGFDKTTVVSTIKTLLETADIAIEYEGVVEHGLYLYENGSADFTDCLMLAHYRRIGCESMLTFDTSAAKLPGAELLKLA